MHGEKSHGDTVRKAAFCKAGIETSQKPTLLAWICTSSLQKYERINFSCLNHPVCSILQLWQLKQTNRGMKVRLYPQVCEERPLPPCCKVSGQQGPAHGSPLQCPSGWRRGMVCSRCASWEQTSMSEGFWLSGLSFHFKNISQLCGWKVPPALWLFFFFFVCTCSSRL